MICIPHTSKVTNKISYCAIMPCVCVFIAQMKYTPLHCTGKLIFWQIFECIGSDAFLMMAMFIFRQIQFKKTETEDCLEVNSVCCKNQDLSSFPARLSPGMWMSRDRGSGVCGQVIPPALSSIRHLQSLHTASVSGENIKKWTKSVAVAVAVVVGCGPALDKWVYCSADGWRLTRTGVRRLTWRNTAVITTHPRRHHVDQGDRWAHQLSTDLFEVSHCPEKARAFALLKEHTKIYTIKSLWRHYANWALKHDK